MSFYMNMGILNEGEQAKAYKEKKREERIENRRNSKSRDMIPYSDDGYLKNYYADTYGNYSDKEKRFINKAERDGQGLSKEDAEKHNKKMIDNSRKGSEIAHREAKRRNDIAKSKGEVYDHDYDKNFRHAVDAANRHVRRHPSSWHENCGIFEDCEIFK